MMRKTFCHMLLALLLPAAAFAQVNEARPFQAYLFNEEYAVYMRINFYEQDIVIPGQELYGPLPGYLGKEGYTFCWPIVEAEVQEQKATLKMVNDYGSEDLTAQLRQLSDSVYELRQLKGSTLKMPESRKWKKLPPVLQLKRK